MFYILSGDFVKRDNNSAQFWESLRHCYAVSLRCKHYQNSFLSIFELFLKCYHIKSKEQNWWAKPPPLHLLCTHQQNWNMSWSLKSCISSFLTCYYLSKTRLSIKYQIPDRQNTTDWWLSTFAITYFIFLTPWNMQTTCLYTTLGKNLKRHSFFWVV